MNKLPNRQKTPPSKQAPVDFSGLHADFHLTSQERRIVSEAYRANEEALLRATRGNLRSFITKDYGAANFEALGGTDGIKTLQRALGVKEDGYFGPSTFQALIAFQESNGLKTDAIAGPETRAKLGISGIGNTWAGTQPTGDKLPSETEWQHTSIDTLTLQSPSTSIQTKKTGIPPAPQFVEQKQNISPVISETKTETVKSTDTSGSKPVFQGMNIQDIRPDEGFLVWSAKHAIRRSAGAVEGIGAVISGLGDLTVFVCEYGKNLIWKNPERKKQMDEQMEEIWNSIKGTEFQGMPDRVMQAIGKEMLRIYLLPTDEQDHAIGNFAGHTIGTLGVLKAWSVAGWYLAKGVEKMAQATRIQSKLAKQGMKESARAARVKAMETRVKFARYWARSLDVIINGFAESTLSYGLQKSIRTIATLLRSSKGSAEKIQAVDAGIHKTDEALKKSTNPEQQAEIAEVREVLDTVKTQLVQEAKMPQNPVENGKKSQTISERPKNEKLKVVSVRRESIDADTSEPKLRSVKSGLDTKHPVEQKDRGSQAPEQKTSLRLVNNPLKNTKSQDIPERISRHNSSVKGTSTTQKPMGESHVSQESATRSKPPKIFKIEWVPPKKLYRSMTMYYHPDRNFHPRAEPIFKCIQEKYNAYEKWGRTTELLKRFQAIARDPEGYIKKEGPTIRPAKGPEKKYAASREQFMKEVRGYAEKNSEAELRQLAQLSPKAFGSALLYRDVYAKILALASQDIGRAEKAFTAFQANPESYFTDRLTSVDLEIQKYTQNAYKGAFKRELEMLKKNRPSLYRAYMQEQRAREMRRAA